MPEKIAFIIDDTDANRTFFERLLAQAGFSTQGFAVGNAAFQAAEATPHIDLAIIDMEVPDMSGLEIVARMRRLYPQACLIIATMHDEPGLMMSAFEKGCDVFLVKPHGFMELFKRLTQGGGAEGLRASAPLMIDQYGPRAFAPV